MPPRRDLDELRAALRGAGLRATPARIAVLGLLRDGGGPRSHGEVAERLAGHGWDRATIWRNLTDLADAGLVRRSDHGDHTWRFEVVSAAHAADQHPHFVCTGCGTVECLPDVEVSAKRTRAPRAVRARQVEVQLRGLCDACG
jgi:Fur family ferric uptake transcriptional regulator